MTPFKYKGQSIKGKCQSWNEFGYGQLDLPFDYLKWDGITLYKGYQENLLSHNISQATVTCKNIDVVFDQFH